jgi:hypothetical protein
MGIFALVVEKLLATDVRTFLTFFLLYLCIFWSSLFVFYPRAGVGEISMVPEFNGILTSFEAMINLGIASKHFEIDFWAEDARSLNQGAMTSLILFAVFYYGSLLLLVILLLRLLMAMLSATFAAVRQQQVLTWRLQFARRVLSTAGGGAAG